MIMMGLYFQKKIPFSEIYIHALVRDENGQKLLEQAIELGWSVSMPDWEDEVKDVNDAVMKYGRMYTLHTIVSSTEDSELKIKLRSKQWFG